MIKKLITITSAIFIFAVPAFAEVKQKVYSISIFEEMAKEKAAFTFKNSKYDKEKGKFEFKINTASGKTFRLIHDGKKVLALVAGAVDTVTSTLHPIEEFETEKQALDRIKDLGLIPLPIESIEKVKK